MSLESFIMSFLNVINWIIVIVFFFVYTDLLRLFAFSLLIINVTKTHNKWIKIPIVIIYILYSILKITEIRNWVVSGNFWEILSVLPFFCMLLLPAIAKKTEIGQYLLSYNSMIVYYIVFNAIWLSINPNDGNLIATMVYALFMFILGQILDMFGNGEQK